jgi:hypothetical protein
MRSGSETASTPTSAVSDPYLSMIRQVYPQTPVARLFEPGESWC